VFNRMNHSWRVHNSFIIIGLVVVLLALSAPDVLAGDPVSPSLIQASAPSCRFGAATFSTLHSAWVGPLNLGWHLNFRTWIIADAEAIEFVPVIRLKQRKDGCTRLPGFDFDPPLTEARLGAVIRSRPGALWVIGNEPDRGPNPEDTACVNRMQDDTAPEVYARAYHDAYAFIKRIDPTAQVATAGLVQVTPSRLQYLDIVWNTYRQVYGVDLPADAWGMHLYVLPEAYADGRPNSIANIAIGTDPALAIRESGNDATRCADAKVYCYAEHDSMAEFANQVVAMRQWMKDHGQQNKPLLLTEYSLLLPDDYLDEYGNSFAPERVAEFANRSLDYLENTADAGLGYPRDGYRLVQRWLWFSVQLEGPGMASNLVNNSLTQMTGVGQVYANHGAAALRTLNLYPKVVHGAVGLGMNGDGTRNARLTAEVRNAGSIPTTGSFTVSFYRDAGLTNLIGSVAVPAGLSGCDSQTALARVVWPNLPPGEYPFWAKVDAGGEAIETEEGDNVLQGKVYVGKYGLAVPSVDPYVKR